MINVTIWNEYPHGQDSEAHKKAYPYGLHNCIKDFLQCSDINVKCALYDESEFGLSDEVLNSTDVLIWWAHVLHDKIPDTLVQKIKERVLKGMGIIFLHSAHYSKVMSSLLGSSGRLNWREANERERIWNVNPTHPIARGVPMEFCLEKEEMYGEYFDIPRPDDIIFLGWFEGGNVFRSGVTFTRGYGKIFYFQPGHETFATYQNENIQTIIKNAVRWTAPAIYAEDLNCVHEVKSKEIIMEK